MAECNKEKSCPKIVKKNCDKYCPNKDIAKLVVDDRVILNGIRIFG